MRITLPEIRYTLLSEGTTDQALIPIINWTFHQKREDIAINPTWADPARFPMKPRDLSDKIRASIDFYPCDILFIHRDSDNEAPPHRYAEIITAFEQCRINLPIICVVPVKMLEAWLLFDEQAIRETVSKPNGRTDLELPKMHQMETLSNPKANLRKALETASGLTGGRRKNFGTAETLIQLSQLIEDFSPLRRLPAFSHLESDIEAYLATIE